MADLIVTIDGPAASGKSTVARLLAQKLEASYLDTGAMYRAATFTAMQAGTNLNNEMELLKVIEKSQLKFTTKQNHMVIQINGIDITERLREPQITANARYIAAAPKIREKLVQMQREFAASQEKIVTEGRDQGTVAFPDANIKFYLTADPGERAKRRQIDLRAKGVDEKLDKIQNAIHERDKSDQSRAIGPLKPAEDAIVVDTTDLDIEEVVEKLHEFVKQKCLKNG